MKVKSGLLRHNWFLLYPGSRRKASSQVVEWVDERGSLDLLRPQLLCGHFLVHLRQLGDLIHIKNYYNSMEMKQHPPSPQPITPSLPVSTCVRLTILEAARPDGDVH